ncbi:hypothetical protein C8R44DRAFT_729316 [Mycena epipterygia]|nr:hypothetical protein C8R44DRAFT_729316 [Mycena epipterygia]
MKPDKKKKSRGKAGRRRQRDGSDGWRGWGVAVNGVNNESRMDTGEVGQVEKKDRRRGVDRCGVGQAMWRGRECSACGWGIAADGINDEAGDLGPEAFIGRTHRRDSLGLFVVVAMVACILGPEGGESDSPRNIMKGRIFWGQKKDYDDNDPGAGTNHQFPILNHDVMALSPQKTFKLSQSPTPYKFDLPPSEVEVDTAGLLRAVGTMLVLFGYVSDALSIGGRTQSNYSAFLRTSRLRIFGPLECRRLGQESKR